MTQLIPRSVVGEQADGVINTLIAALATICDEEYKSLVDAYKPGEIAPVLTDADKTMEDADRELGIGDIVWVFYNKDKVGPYWWPASIIGSSGVGMYDVAWLPYRGDGGKNQLQFLYCNPSVLLVLFEKFTRRCGSKRLINLKHDS